MFTNEEITADQITRIADALGAPGEYSSSGTITRQLARIADALERIADALEPNRKAWTTNKEDEMNLHSMVYAIMTDRQRDQSKPSRSRYGNYQ